jgi:hypothetical protein
MVFVEDSVLVTLSQSWTRITWLTHSKSIALAVLLPSTLTREASDLIVDWDWKIKTLSLLRQLFANLFC